MLPRFQNLPFRVSTLDGRTFTLLIEIFYLAQDGTRYCLPVGAASDGASTPPEVWPLLPPFGPYWPAAYLHDAAYRNTLLVWNGDAWVPAALTKAQCDALLLEAMEILGVDLLQRRTIYEAVVLAGNRAFHEDRSVLPTRRIPATPYSSSSSSSSSSSNSPLPALNTPRFNHPLC